MSRRRYAGVLPCAIALLLAACGGGGPNGEPGGNAGGSGGDPPGGSDAGSGPPVIALAVAGPEGLTAATPVLVSSTRVGRTTFDYSYTVQATNGGTVALTGVTGAVTSDAATTVVTDASLAFGDLAPGASATSSDTFTIRQDRAAPVAAANLTITLAGTPVNPGPAEGVLLGGQPGDNALAAIIDMRPIPARDEDVVDRAILTRLDVAITATATVGEVNGALQSIGAGIAGMRAGLPVLVVAVPRQPDEAALEALAARLAGLAGIRIALPGREAIADLAPPGAPANGTLALRHLNDARFPAAWNLRPLAGPGCSSRPVVLVADLFARPIPANSDYADFPAEVTGVDDNGIGGGGTSSTASFHGYDVLTTLAAGLDDTVPTGAAPFPGCLDIRTVQIAGLSQAGVAYETAIAASLPGQGKVVVNTSLGDFYCSQPCTPDRVGGSAFGVAFGAATLRAILAPNVDRVLWSTAAGNELDEDIAVIYPGTGLAAYTSTFAAAARADPDLTFAADESLWDPPPGCQAPPCFPSLLIAASQLDDLQDYLTDLGAAGRTPARNVLVVGSTRPVTNLPSDFSNTGPDVSAVGEEIPTMRRTASGDFEVTRGTSFAAPQVAALAAYLWMISPELRDSRPVADTISAITANVGGDAKQIDAYATALSLDPVGDPDPATWLVRRTLLDADRSGRFTEVDLAAFITRYFEAPDLVDPVAPEDRDYGQYDLNGDGYTGGARAAVSFDLDRNGSTRYGASHLAEAEVQAGGERLALDERFVADLDVLCYYAYSALYQGSMEARESLLANKCFPISVVVSPSSPTVAPGGTTTFSAEVRGTTDPRVTWSLPDGGGTIDAAGLFTAGGVDGTFRVRAASVVNPAVFGEATVTINATVSVVTLGAGIGVVFANIRCSDVIQQDRDPDVAGVSQSSGNAAISFNGTNSSAEGTASYSFSSQSSGGAVAFVSASGNGRGIVRSPQGLADCSSRTGSLDLEGTGDARVGFDFTVSGGPVSYSVSGDATETTGPAFGLIILTGPGGDIYWRDSLGGSEGNPGGILQPGTYTMRGQAGAGARFNLLGGATSKTETSSFSFTLSLGPP